MSDSEITKKMANPANPANSRFVAIFRPELALLEYKSRGGVDVDRFEEYNLDFEGRRYDVLIAKDEMLRMTGGKESSDNVITVDEDTPTEGYQWN